MVALSTTISMLNINDENRINTWYGDRDGGGSEHNCERSKVMMIMLGWLRAHGIDIRNKYSIS